MKFPIFDGENNYEILIKNKEMNFDLNSSNYNELDSDCKELNFFYKFYNK